MDQNILLDQLEELIEKLGIQIRYDAVKQDENLGNLIGGLCLLKGKHVLIINSKATTREKIWTLGVALKQFDYEEIYIRPVLREFLEKIPDQRRLSMNGNPGPEIRSHQESDHRNGKSDSYPGRFSQ